VKYGSVVTQVHGWWQHTIAQRHITSLFTFYSNFGASLYCFWDRPRAYSCKFAITTSRES